MVHCQDCELVLCIGLNLIAYASSVRHGVIFFVVLLPGLANIGTLLLFFSDYRGATLAISTKLHVKIISALCEISQNIGVYFVTCILVVTMPTLPPQAGLDRGTTVKNTE